MRKQSGEKRRGHDCNVTDFFRLPFLDRCRVAIDRLSVLVLMHEQPCRVDAQLFQESVPRLSTVEGAHTSLTNQYGWARVSVPS